MGPRYQLHGTKGSFLKYGEDPQEDRLKAGESPVGDDWCHEDAASHGLLHTEMHGEVVRRTWPSLKGDFGKYYRNLYRSIREDAPLHEKPQHGHNVVRMIELAFESSERRAWVDVSGLIAAGA
jgi:predicted dehydrogenase